jgi:hypothetical protein
VTHDDPTHRAMVDRLASELVPVRRLWSPWRRLAAWIALALGTVALAAVVGLRHDLRAQLERSHFVATLAILLAGAGLGATVALLAAVPGRIGRREARGVAVGLLVMAVTLALLGDSAPMPSPRTFVATGLQCFACVALFAFVPWLALYRAARRAAPIEAATTGLCIGAASLLVGAAAVRVACPVDDAVHLAVWHGMPVAVWAAASMLVGAATLERWTVR